MAKRGFLAYGQDDEPEKGESSKSDDGPRDASEMKKIDLVERFLDGGFGGDKTMVERRRGQLKAFAELLECYGVKTGG